ncbi:MAG: hypothetical protein A3K19_00115 [Lentisphaerae bacterium RIFOXYB12_FULL_65_16]|nr:MAG: hypothetical protein A3K18_10360 [Lentisphaerae bacterium RIFOXYA12_64_32]OGV86200.1 MAG: hypothetical protein A3K19_00115 [Lentisphaerae bacterium RIFOXYB12_FULL_65_16]
MRFSRLAAAAATGLLVLYALSAPAAPSDAALQDLRSPVATVRASAAAALGRAGDRAAAPALLAALADSDAGVRAQAARALGVLRAAEAVPALSAALRDRDVNTRFYAAYALGEIKDVTAAKALLGAFGDPEYNVRDQAAWALRELNDPATAPLLIARLKAPDADVPKIAWILQRLGAAQVLPHLAELRRDADPRVRCKAVQVLVELRDPAVVSDLLAALQDAEPAVRLCACQGLSSLADETHLPALREQAAREQDAGVRTALQELVRKLSRPEELAAWWSFDDGSAKTATDVTEHGNNGEIKGCTPVPGRVGGALSFTKGGYVELGKPAALSLASRPFTLAAWAKSESRNGVIVARGGAACGFALYVKDGVPKFGLKRGDDSAVAIAAGMQDVVGRWVYLTAVVKSDTIELYVDGKLDAKAKTTGCMTGDPGQGMEIGFDAGNSAVEITDAFEGIIDEVKVFNVALTPEQIAKRPADRGAGPLGPQ